MSAAVAAPVIGSVAGALIGKKGSDKAAESSQLGAEYQEAARQEATGYVQPQNIYKMAEWMYPGLLPQPAAPEEAKGTSGKGGMGALAPLAAMGGGGMALPFMLLAQKNREQQRVAQNNPAAAAYIALKQSLNPAFKLGTGQLGMGMLKNRFSNIPGRQEGGPVSMGQPYVVGEQGPEVMVPEQQGTIVPTPGPTVPGPGQAGPDEMASGGGQGRFGQFLAGIMARRQGGGQQQPTQQAPAEASLGELATGHTRSFLEDPGQLQGIQYERAQEQANRGLQTNIQGIMGGLTGRGIDPRSGMGQTLIQTATRSAGMQRNEAARQLAEQEEALRRQDIQTGMTAYQNFLNQVFGIIGTQAGVVGGTGGYPSTPAINPYNNMAQAIATGGNLLGQHFANQPQTTTQSNGVINPTPLPLTYVPGVG